MRPWTVTPHDPIEKLDDHLWIVHAEVPNKVPVGRRATYVRLSDGRLVIHNAVPLDDAAQAEIERFGEPAFLVIPNRFHCLDLAPYAARYPKIKVIAPAPQAAGIAKRTKRAVDGGWDALPQDPTLAAEPLDGSKAGEAVLVVRAPGGASLVWGDSYMKLPNKLPGFRGFVLGLVGSAGGPKVTRIAQTMLVGDKRALAAHLDRLAARPDLHRLIPSHGALSIGPEASADLRAAANTLR